MSAQLSIEFSRPVEVPDAGTQRGTLLRALQRGERLTPAEAFSRYGCMSLSQRMGELRRNGWPIKSESVQVGPRTYVSRYWMET